MGATFRTLMIVLAIVVAGAPGIASAQTPSMPIPGMTKEQYDALVDAISSSVVQKLKSEGQPPAVHAKPSKGAPPTSAQIVTTPLKSGPGEIAVFVQRAGTVVKAFPDLGHHMAQVVGRVGDTSGSSRGLGFFLVLLGLIGAAAVAAEAALRAVLAKLRVRLAAGAGPEQGLRSLLNLAALLALDGLGVLAVWLICNGARIWFEGGTAQDKLAQAVLAGIFDWRLIMLLFRFVLNPDLPTARLCATSSENARPMYLRVAAVILVLIVGRSLGRMLIENGTPPEALAAYQLGGMVIFFGAFMWVVIRSRTAAREWLVGLSVAAPLAGVVGRNWVGMATAFFVALAATQTYSTVSGRTQVGGAMLLTLTLVVGLLFFETFMQAFVRRLDSFLPGRTAASDAPKLPDVVARCVRVAVLIGVAVAITQEWVVNVFGLASADQWEDITRSSRTAAASLFLAFVLWELFKYATQPYMARPKGRGDGDAAGAPASRISTMMPLLRTTVAIMITFVAVMIALEDFGINVMPLIAGASIFGIAISFGSQTLVRDIVSGIFYLTDDAFRVGEYIDCGRAKGTVEGFTLRSIKLRHQNGQVHTIPFGQLGQITNFSRDWITVKFNMRFARDTDIEKLRKAAKKIGQDMLEVPEIKAEILEPFKMQGIADIVESALLIRFKFTAKPGNPAMIQREAVKRMFGTLPELGIEFAKEGAAVVVHAASVSPDPALANVAPSPTPAPVPAAAG